MKTKMKEKGESKVNPVTCEQSSVWRCTPVSPCFETYRRELQVGRAGPGWTTCSQDGRGGSAGPFGGHGLYTIIKFYMVLVSPDMKKH
jgi:hypothetical protein